MLEHQLQRITIPQPVTTSTSRNSNFLETQQQHQALLNILTTQRKQKQKVVTMTDTKQMNKKGNGGMSSHQQRPQTEMIMLTQDFSPGDFDVICQRGKFVCCCCVVV